VVGFLAKEIMFAQTRTPPEQMPLPKGGVSGALLEVNEGMRAQRRK
jgi:hypothetical protein